MVDAMRIPILCQSFAGTIMISSKIVDLALMSLTNTDTETVVADEAWSTSLMPFLAQRRLRAQGSPKQNLAVDSASAASVGEAPSVVPASAPKAVTMVQYSQLKQSWLPDSDSAGCVSLATLLRFRKELELFIFNYSVKLDTGVDKILVSADLKDKCVRLADWLTDINMTFVGKVTRLPIAGSECGKDSRVAPRVASQICPRVSA